MFQLTSPLPVFEVNYIANAYFIFQGKQYTSIESSVDFNDLCVVPNTGLSMMAVEDQKMQIYYIPSLGGYFTSYEYTNKITVTVPSRSKYNATTLHLNSFHIGLIHSVKSSRNNRTVWQLSNGHIISFLLSLVKPSCFCTKVNVNS